MTFRLKLFAQRSTESMSDVYARTGSQASYACAAHASTPLAAKGTSAARASAAAAAAHLRRHSRPPAASATRSSTRSGSSRRSSGRRRRAHRRWCTRRTRPPICTSPSRSGRPQMWLPSESRRVPAGSSGGAAGRTAGSRRRPLAGRAAGALVPMQADSEEDAQFCVSAAESQARAPARAPSVGGMAPHLRRNWARPLPHLHRDCRNPPFPVRLASGTAEGTPLPSRWTVQRSACRRTVLARGAARSRRPTAGCSVRSTYAARQSTVQRNILHRLASQCSRCVQCALPLCTTCLRNPWGP